MNDISFTIFQTPTGKATVKHTKQGITYHTKEQRFNADSLMTEMMQYRPTDPINEPVILYIKAYFPVPNSKPAWWKQAAIAGYIQHDKKPDDDNCRKQIADCLEKLQFVKNDSQIYHAITQKFYSNNPRWEVQIFITPNITRKDWIKVNNKEGLWCNGGFIEIRRR